MWQRHYCTTEERRFLHKCWPHRRVYCDQPGHRDRHGPLVISILASRRKAFIRHRRQFRLQTTYRRPEQYPIGCADRRSGRRYK
jgi:hypothetical protein